MLTDVQTIILATENRTPSKKTIPITEKICGQELIVYPTALIYELSLPIAIVYDRHDKEIPKIIAQRYSKNIQFIEQQEPERKEISASRRWKADTILIIKADIPLMTSALIKELYTKHKESSAAVSFIAAHNSDPNVSYTRICKENDTIHVQNSSVHHQDIEKYCCVDGGTYLVSQDFLALYTDNTEHIADSLSLSDLIHLANQLNKKVTMVMAPYDTIRHANNYQELWAIEHIKQAELVRYWMERGVRFANPQSTHIDLDITIGSGSFIGAGVHLLNGTTIGTNSVINAFSIIEQSSIGDNVIVHSHSVINHSTIGNNAQVGPFAHVQIGTQMSNHTTIGNFVETKRTTIGSYSKAKHLAYLGDATIGSKVNIGAGTITCNYDGNNKNTTTIEDNVFIGSNNSLVAPLTIHHDSFTAAGSVITDDVPSQSLAIGRSRQLNKKRSDTKKESATVKRSISFAAAVRSSSDSILE